MNALRLALVAVVLLIAGGPALAGRGVDRATGQAIWDAAVNGQTTRIGTGAGAMKVITPLGTSTAGAAGSVVVTGAGNAPVASKAVPVSIVGTVAKDAIVGGVLGCATGGVAGCILGVATPLAIAYLSSSGTRLNPQTNEPEREDKSVCTGPQTCYNYRLTINGQTLIGTVDFLCRAYTAQSEVQEPNYVFPMLGTSGTNCNFGKFDKITGAVNYPSGYRSVGIVQNVVIPPASPTWYPATSDVIKQSLYNNTPNPGIVDELSKYGNITWPLGNVSVTGPASINGEKSVTVKPDGSTVTTQRITDYSYSGDGATQTQTRTVTTTKAPDGSTTATETTTTTAGDEHPADTGSGTSTGGEEPAPTDTALPPVPDLYTRKYPDGIVGVWNQKKDQLKSTQLAQLATGLMPNVASGGSCPSWNIDLNWSLSWAYGIHDVAPPCWIWDVAKAILIFSALLLARSLIFGG